MQRFNIYRRNDGRWEGRIPRGKKDNGKRKFQYVFGKSREQVRDKMIQIKNNEPQASCKESINSIFSEWISSAKHRVKESTVANYVMKAKKHILPVFGDRIITSINSDDIYKFIENKKIEGLSNRYISDIIILMKSLFKYAVRLYHIFNPLDGLAMPKRGTPDIRLLDNKEQECLQTYISENRNHSTMGVALSMTTGIRIGELCALKWQDIDLEKRILTVRKTMQRIQVSDSESKTKIVITDPKSESSKRTIPITQNMVDFLKSFKGKSNEYVLSGAEKPIEPRTSSIVLLESLKMQCCCQFIFTHCVICLLLPALN